MTFEIKHQDQLSRGELLLRSFFGWLYILIPHAFILFFMALWGAILSFISFWIILFTGRYPQSFFEYQVGLIRWQTRLQARMYNLSDGYPAFGINATDEATQVEIPYPERLSRGMVLVKLLFGWLYVAIPHFFVLFFLSMAAMFIAFIGWWIILFTGKLPKSMHDFITGFLRWNTRVSLYMQNMTDVYPPFSLS
jgi:hypothetical protein